MILSLQQSVKKRLFLMAGLLFLISSPLVLAQNSAAATEPGMLFIKDNKPKTRTTIRHSYADAVKAAAPSVVNIYTDKRRAFPNRPDRNGDRFRRMHFHSPYAHATRSTLGSGVVMDKKGYILTNYHVIRNATRILVALPDGRKARAKVIGGDPDTDLAVLHVPFKDLQPITLSNSDKIHVGDVVLAIGNPFGLGQTVTQGIVSAIGRSRVGINQLESYIQTDAAINPGNSGGALINTHGQLVGINTGIYSRSGGYQGVGFAIPVNVALNVMHQIIKRGYVKRGWLGVKIRALSANLVRMLKTKQTSGIFITQVVNNGPAAKAGLRAQDIVTHLNNRRINTARAFFSYIAQLKPGATVAVQFVRNNQKKKLSIKIGERPAPKLSDTRGLQPQDNRDRNSSRNGDRFIPDDRR